MTRLDLDNMLWGDVPMMIRVVLYNVLWADLNQIFWEFQAELLNQEVSVWDNVEGVL